MSKPLNNEKILKQRLQELREAIFKEWLTYHEPIPDMLYHYTTADGLNGITGSNMFWMTDVKYMNDLSELQYASDLIAHVLEEENKKYSSHEILNVFFHRIRDTFSPFKGGLEVFATCFCEKGNLLSQWRAYGAQGGGYAIGFDIFQLQHFLQRVTILRKVIYDRDKQMSIVNKAIDATCNKLKQLTAGKSVIQADADKTLPIFCQFFSKIVGEYLFCFKHPEFRQEEEWRLVHISTCNPIIDRNSEFAQIRFRPYHGNIIPFFEVSFENAVRASLDDSYGIAFPLREIVIGPTINPDLNEQSVRMILNRLNPDHYPRIKKSGIPLRWL